MNFDGFDVSSNPFQDIEFIGPLSLKHVIWILEVSNFKFYINNKLINDQECLSNTNNSWINIITNSKLYFLMTTKNTRYSLKTCPFIFQKTQIKFLGLKEIKSSYIDSNILSFLKINNSNDIDSFVLQADFESLKNFKELVLIAL